MSDSNSTSIIDLNDPDRVTVDDRGRAIGYFCRQLPARINRNVLEQLKQQSRLHGNRNVRLCLHDSPAATFHSMIILEHRGGYYRPHKHLHKGESFHLLEGQMGVLTFAEDGTVLDTCLLSPEDFFLYRIQVGQYHAILPISDVVLYHESKPGPFLGADDSIFAPWSPSPKEKDQVAALQARFRQLLKVHE